MRRTKGLETQILEHLAEGPATVREMAEALGKQPNQVRARISGLARMGVVHHQRHVRENHTRRNLWELRA